MKKIVSRIYMGLILFFMYAPIFVMIVFSFNSTKSRAVFQGFSLKWYKALFNDQIIIDSLGRSLLVAVLAALISTVLGTMAAVGLRSLNKKIRSVLMSLNSIPMVNPEIVTGVSMMLMFVVIYRATGLLKPGFATLLLAHITFCVPYVILSVLPKLNQMNPHLYEAAQDLGCRPSLALYKVVLPEITPGIITGALMAFTLSLDDFIISYFTSGSTAQTLPVVIYSMTKKRISPKINALSTILFVVVLLLLIVINIRQQREENRSKKKYG